MDNLKTKKMVLASIFSAIIVAMTLIPYTGYISYGLFIEITTLHIVVILGAITLGPKYGAFLGGVWGVTCMARAFTNMALWGIFLNPMISLVPRIIVGFVAGWVFNLLSKKSKGSASKPLQGIILGLFSGGLIFSGLFFGSGQGGGIEWHIGVKIAIGVAAAVLIAAAFIFLGKKHGNQNAFAAAVAALCASLTNTFLVLISLNIFGNMIKDFSTLFDMFKGIFQTIIGINGSIELVAAIVLTPILASAVVFNNKSSSL